MLITTQAIRKIESDPNWKQKAISAFKNDSLKAIETNPIGVFVIEAIKAWSEIEIN